MPKTIEIKAINVKKALITIEGDGTLCLNKMNAINERALSDKQKGKAKDTSKPNEWEGIITSIHWRDKLTRNDFSEEMMADLLQNNAPCITSFGLKKSIGQAVTRNGYDQYSTKIDASINIVETLVPVTFAEHQIRETLMAPKKGSPVLVRLNEFKGWSATFTLSYVENAYTVEQILNFITAAGFSIGIGSGRSSGYGRYHLTNVNFI